MKKPPSGVAGIATSAKPSPSKSPATAWWASTFFSAVTWSRSLPVRAPQDARTIPVLAQPDGSQQVAVAVAVEVGRPVGLVEQDEAGRLDVARSACPGRGRAASRGRPYGTAGRRG